MTKKVAILGTTPSRMQAPIADESWEIWTIGPGGKDAHRWNRLYETHTTWPEDFDGYLNDLSKVNTPQQVRTLVPMAERVKQRCWKPVDAENPRTLIDKPAEWIDEKITGDWSGNQVIDTVGLFERYRRMWFTTSICYAIAEAIEYGATDIGCFGIDLESDEEHISQHVGCAYFLDIARLAGINIYLPDGCGLDRDLTPYPNRYETHQALQYEKKVKYLNSLIPQAESEFEGARMMVYRTEGIILAMREHKASTEVVAAAEKDYHNHAANMHRLAAQVNQLKGELNATTFWQRLFVWGLSDHTLK